jgi:predicted nucleic acid-binding protein
VNGGHQVVLDASAAIAFLLNEEHGPRVERTLRQLQTAAGAVLVPPIFWLEIVNAIAKGRNRVGARVFEAIAEMDALGLETIAQDRALVLLTVDLVERQGLISYDASYLALAIQQDAHLLTLDRRLAAAAGPRAIALGDGRVVAETAPTYEAGVTWPDYRGASALLARLRAEVLTGR